MINRIGSLGNTYASGTTDTMSGCMDIFSGYQKLHNVISKVFFKKLYGITTVFIDISIMVYSAGHIAGGVISISQ